MYEKKISPNDYKNFNFLVIGPCILLSIAMQKSFHLPNSGLCHLLTVEGLLWILSGVAGNCESGNAERDGVDMLHGHPAGFGCCSGGYDVVDEKQVFAGKSRGVDDVEDVFHVVETLQSVFAGLCVRVAYADKVVAHYGAREHHGYALAEQEALIVAASALFARMKRYGNEDVDIVEASALCDVHTELSAHDEGEMLVAVVFYLVQNLLSLVFASEDEQCCRALYWQSSDVSSFDEVVVVGSVESKRQVEHASGADFFFVAHKWSAAQAARARKEEFYEIA